MSAVQTANPNAETMGKGAALMMNIGAAKGMHDVLKTNLGPKGTIKMLVGGAGDIKMTKDGNVLLREMQIQHPTAVMIARTAVAQDDQTGDGTSSTVILIGELMKQSERFLAEGVHPRVLVEGFEAAKVAVLELLEKCRVPTPTDMPDRELLRCVAHTSLSTKVNPELADQLTDIVTDAVLCIRKPDTPIDLHMVEIMHMKHKFASDTRLINGLVLDHGARHPDMPKYLEDVFVLTCNLSLEYEKSEVNSSFLYSSADQREKMVAAERQFTDDRVLKVIALKKKVCGGTNKGFIVINQKGIDPMSLDLLAKEGIVGLRRAKKRNMERLVLACGGFAVNAEEELTPECLGHAGKIYEYILGEEKYTFVEDVKNPTSCTILIKGHNDHVLAQIKDATRDGLRAVSNTLIDGAVIPGAGAFEALEVIPKILAENAGFDGQEAIIALQEEQEKGNIVGIDITTGDPMDPVAAGVWDNFNVKKQILNSAPIITSQLLLVDEVMRAGRNMRGK
ncbi:T-complex protein 1 subunit zeta [Cymbomonas tetramitiformis]|uniref:T-complex protein 1 subunit zeta n=1 Tax=Cymbomonas tetramitiformis TaxID=36881 RepID=A0AAE0BVD5_9CHLO|nr:T-complex protein 1 subunit zeta [Cymbomonas tetramitiformis]